MQESEVGDGTNFAVVFGGALLEVAKELLRLGVTTEGYEKALDQAVEILPKLVCREVMDYRNQEQVKEAPFDGTQLGGAWLLRQRVRERTRATSVCIFRSEGMVPSSVSSMME